MTQRLSSYDPSLKLALSYAGTDIQEWVFCPEGGGGALRFEWVSTAKQPLNLEAVNAKI